MRANYDQHLATLAPYGCVLDNGLTSHVPMVIEAMRAMGQEAKIGAWIEPAREHILPRPERSHAISANGWRDALGQGERFSDWSAYFAEQMANRDWRHVVSEWCGRFAPGFASAAVHGVIRTAHAARAMSDCETPECQREIADALAAWAAQYGELPVEMKPSRPARSPLSVLVDLPLVDESDRRNDGSIVRALFQLATVEPFADAVASAELPDELLPAAQALSSAFARMFVANVQTPLQAIVFTHAITGVGAVANLAGAVEPEVAKLLLQRAWQVGCALHSAYGRPMSDQDAGGQAPSVEELVTRCIDNGDDHAIKLTEACISFYRTSGDYALLRAAAHGIDTLG